MVLGFSSLQSAATHTACTESLPKDARSDSVFVFHNLQLAIAKNNIIKLQEENHQLRSENELILMRTRQHLEVSHPRRGLGSWVMEARYVGRQSPM